MQGPESALLVDDEQHVRLFMKMVLREAGIDNVMEAENGQRAVEIYAEKRPDLVLLDVNMPVKEGLEALQEIMEIDSEAVVVMLTSVASRHSVERSAELGASQYIRKDTPKAEVVKTLKELIGDVWGGGDED